MLRADKDGDGILSILISIVKLTEDSVFLQLS